MLPPATSSRPSGRKVWPPQKRFFAGVGCGPSPVAGSMTQAPVCSTMRAGLVVVDVALLFIGEEQDLAGVEQ